jgi:hypothetical protein
MKSAALALALVFSSQQLDFRIEPGNRISLPASDLDLLLTRLEESKDLIRTATTAASLEREARILSEVACKEEKAELSKLILPVEQCDSPLLWATIGTALASAVCLGGGLIWNQR